MRARKPVTRELVVARVCAVLPQAFLIVSMPLNLFVPSLEWTLRDLMCVLVSACVAALVWVCIRPPRLVLGEDFGRDTGYTVFAGSLGLLWPAYTTGVWPLLTLPVIAPVLVVVETVRRRGRAHPRRPAPLRRTRRANLRRKRRMRARR